MRVLIAPEAFKGSLSAREAAEAFAGGVLDARPEAEVRLLPLADGGDGSVQAFLRAGFTAHPVTTRGPTGDPVAAEIAVRGRTAVAEIANTCGLALVPDGTTAALTSSSTGLGDAIRAALDLGADQVVICLGGSASTDGGAGMLSALGAVLRDASGRALEPSGAALADVADLDLSGLDPRIAVVGVTLATDVSSPLLGAKGAAAVFAPQKGADPEQVRALEVGLSRWSTVLTRATGADAADVRGAGAAGGTGAAAIAVLGARVVSGAEYIHQELGLAEAIDWADVVITGEGSLDRQSLLGKGAVRVAGAASRAGRTVLAVCGRITLTPDELTAIGIDRAWSLSVAAGADRDPRSKAAAHARRGAAELISGLGERP